AYEVPEAGSRNSRGTAMVNVLPLAVGESVTTMIDLERIHENVNLFMVTEFGVVKRTAIEEYRNIRRSGLNAINLDEGDRLICVIVTTGNQDILIGTKLGMAIRCNEEDVRLMKRAAHGVRGIKLKTGDVVVGAGVLESDESEAQVFTISEEGYGKRNEADAYNVQKRGGIGTKNFRINDKTGDVVAVEVVHNDDEVMLISEQGKIIRFNMNDIAVKKGKAISGVKTQNLDEGDKVASIAVIPASEIESED
ncbi:DNA gyrase subunit A, partial [Parabacteroides distasonis]|nr:DNA gyrase subunit A [Parabacteroides distasonis]